VRFLLTSGGITNASIHDALVDLLGKPIAESSALCTGGDRALGMVDFSMFPHADHENMPDHSMANADKRGAGISGPGYAIDDQTAIRVVDATVEVVSEGQWRLFTPSSGVGESAH